MADGLETGTALVVGGSGGVGAVIATMLAAQGAPVALTYHGNRAKAESVADAIRDAGGEASFHQLDAGDEAATGALIEEIGSRAAGLRTLVYAAGPLVPQIYMSQTTPEQMRHHLVSDALGFFNLCHFALPHLRKSRGVIVAIQSAAQFRWCAADGLSVVPKSAVNAVMTGIAKEEGRHGIRANGVALGIIETGSFIALQAQGHISNAYLEAAHKNTALKHNGKPEDVAEAVLWLASDKSRFVTGQVIRVDGGFSL